MNEDRPYRVDFVRDLGEAVDGSMNRAKQHMSNTAHATGMAVHGRPLTAGERQMIDAMFGPAAGYGLTRVFSHNYFWPYPNDRAVTPNGAIYFPKADYRDDFSSPATPLVLRALFMHEATHLYQWYVLKQLVWARRAFDSSYKYTLVPGRKLKDYGLEQMGQIVQDYYTISRGGVVRGLTYSVADYEDAVPVRAR